MLYIHEMRSILQAQKDSSVTVRAARTSRTNLREEVEALEAELELLREENAALHRKQDKLLQRLSGILQASPKQVMPIIPCVLITS